MTSKEKHFLDTNIILSIVLENKKYDICFKYFKKNQYEKIISNHVKTEGEGIISFMRLIIVALLKYIKKYMANKKIKLINMEKEIYKIKKSFIDSHKDLPEFEERQAKFIEIVNDLFEEFDEAMRNSILDLQNVEILDKKARNIIRNKEHKFVKCISSLTIYKFVNSPSDEKRINSLIDNGNHKKDAIILNDEYNMSKELDTDIYFITYDTGILSLYNEINTVLKSIVHVHSPSIYI